MSESELYDRQVRLREVGREGQTRIERSHAVITARAGASIELTYLLRAGVLRAEIRRGPGAAFPHADFFLFSGPASVADGAQAALEKLLRSLNSA
jgi:molybdopterin/thiamine biosynthesis adenylyltransferase